MQIAYHTVDLEAILELYSRGFKVKPEDKVVKYETFIDGNQGKVIYKLFIQPKAEISPDAAPLVVLPDAKN